MSVVKQIQTLESIPSSLPGRKSVPNMGLKLRLCQILRKSNDNSIISNRSAPCPFPRSKRVPFFICV